MKKFLTLVCMITCIFGLTACGSEETLTSYEQQKVDFAKQVATQKVLPLLGKFMDDSMADAFDDYTADEVEYMMSNDYELNADGYAVTVAVDSFYNAKADMGSIVSLGEPKAQIDDKQIIVRVPVTGEKKSGEAEIIFSNDMFMVLESAALNPTSSFGELMGRAGLNTLIGMGTVFVVLILISLIISCFAFIPKIQAKFAKKNEKEDVEAVGINNAVAQIVEQEQTVEESVEETDNLELVAVIAAAIAASEGAATTDGFVVRSVRRVGRNRR